MLNEIPCKANVTRKESKELKKIKNELLDLCFDTMKSYSLTDIDTTIVTNLIRDFASDERSAYKKRIVTYQARRYILQSIQQKYSIGFYEDDASFLPYDDIYLPAEFDNNF